jgi:hypothetical protein
LGLFLLLPNTVLVLPLPPGLKILPAACNIFGMNVLLGLLVERLQLTPTAVVFS